MGGLLALGLGIGAGIQAWRQWPPDGPTTTTSGVLVMLVAICAAYLAGRWRGRGGSTATATATAIASAQSAAVGNTVQVFVASPGDGPTSTRLVSSVPSDEAPWLTGESVPVLDASMLDGLDVDELIDMSGEHVTD